MCTRPGFGLFIAYFTIAIYGFAAIGFVTLLANKKYFDKLVPEDNGTIDIQIYKKTLRAVLICFIVLCLFVITLSGIMAKGIFKRRHRLMAPWLFICVAAICVFLIYNISMAIKLRRVDGKFATGMCWAILQCLIIYPIYSLYRDIRIENQIGGRRM